MCTGYWAGISKGFIETRLGGDLPVVRIMSNTPVLVDEAMSVISAGRFAGAEHLRRTGELVRPAGKMLRIPGSQQDAATALPPQCFSSSPTAEAVVPSIKAARGRGLVAQG